MTENPKQRDAEYRVPLDLVPPALIVETAAVYAKGLEPEGRYPFNWRDGGASLRTYIAASLRHLMALADGEDIDEKSGCHHAACVAANMGVIVDALRTDSLIDDRHKKSADIGKQLRKYEKKSRSRAALEELVSETQKLGLYDDA